MKKINIDELLKKSVDEKEFDYDESSWNNFQKLSQDQSSKNRNRRLIWILLSVIVTLTLALLGVLYFKAANQEIPKSLTNTAQTIDQKTSNQANSTNESINKKTEDYNAEKLATQASVLQNEKLDNVNFSDSKTRKAKQNDTNSLVGTHSIIESTTTSPSKDSNEQLHTSSFDNKNEPTLTNTKKYPEPKEQNKLVESLKIPSLELSNLMAPKTKLNLSDLDLRIRTLKTQSLRRPINFYVGSTVAAGSLSHLSGSIGLGAIIPINDSWNIDLSTNYESIWANKLPVHRSSGVQYNLQSSNFFESSIEADQFNSIQIPLMLERRFKRNSIGLGINYSYLFLVRGTIESNKEGTNTRRSTWIVENGLRRNQWSATLQFSRYLNSRIKLSFGASYALSDVYSSEIQHKQRLHNGHVGVNYIFSEKK